MGRRAGTVTCWRRGSGSCCAPLTPGTPWETPIGFRRGTGALLFSHHAGRKEGGRATAGARYFRDFTHRTRRRIVTDEFRERGERGERRRQHNARVKSHDVRHLYSHHAPSGVIGGEKRVSHASGPERAPRSSRPFTLAESASPGFVPRFPAFDGP